MAISKRKYVEKYGGDFMANPRKFLTGHKIQSKHRNLFTTAVGYGGVLVELMYMAHVLKKAAQGGKALKKADNFLIRTYHTEGELIDNIGDHSAEFVMGLSPQDAEQFENAENIHVIGYYPNFEGGDPVQALKLNTLLRNGYTGKFGKGQFVVIMFGNSAIRTQEIKVAKTKAKVNARKAKRVTSPNVLKARLRKKVKGQIATINRKLAGKKVDAQLLTAEMQEFNQIARQFGLQGSYEENASALKMRLNRFDKSNSALVNKMSDSDKLIWSMVQDQLKAGNRRAATRMIKKANSPILTKMYKGDALSSADALGTRTKRLKEQGKRIREQVKSLRDRIGNWEIDRSDAANKGNKAEAFRIGKNIASAKHRIGKLNGQLRTLKSRLGVVATVGSGDFNASTIKSKAEILADVNAEMQELAALGMSAKETLTAGIAKIDADAATKQAIRDAAEAEMEAGTPVQLATQQAIQQVVGEEMISGSQMAAGSDSRALIKEFL